MLVVAVLAFTAVFALALLTMGETLVLNAEKILAALDGRSFASAPVLVTRPVQVRVVSRRVSQPVSVQPRLSAAA
jgi:hypothetical protein